MGDRLSAERACKDPNPIIDGRKANVNLAILGAKPRGNLTQGELLQFLAGHVKVKNNFLPNERNERSLMQVIERISITH